MKRFTIAALFCCAVSFAQQPASELKYAVILTRHGVRSPTWEPARLNQYSAAPWPDFGVPPGNLTAHGRTLMTWMGGFYRDYFSQRGLLGKPACADAARTYYWADTDQRTLETARALAETIQPGCPAEIHSAGEGKSDSLFDPIEAGVAKPDPALALAAINGRVGPKLDALIDANRAAFDTLVHVLNGNGKAGSSIFDQPIAITANQSGANMTGPLNLASTLTEDFLLEYTNGMSGDKLGWGRLNATNLQQMMVLHTTYADLMRRTPYLATTRGSNLLSHILRSIQQAADGKPVEGGLGTPNTSLLVISGHDTNISNLSGMLNMSWLLPSYQRDDSPPGGALVFSLWRSATGAYTVRTQFIAQTLDQMHDATPLSLDHPPAMSNIFIPGCSSSTEGYPCTWINFQSLIERTVRASPPPQ